MVGRLARRLLAVVVWLLILLGLAITIVPRFLDRVYYRGPVSGHFDGGHFFNPDGDDEVPPPSQPSGRASLAWRIITGRQRVGWPDAVAVTPGYGDTTLVACPRLSAGHVENWARCNRSTMDPAAMSVTWIGHATALVQTANFAMLTDPVWSTRAGPLGFGPARVAAPGIRLTDLPPINLILVSHNHYDHMDLDTLRALWLRDRPLIVTSLGNDTILRAAGIGDAAHLLAFDWGGGVTQSASCAAPGPPCPSFTVRVTRNHHWGSRWGSDTRRALWSSFTVDTPAGRVFFAGDTGFGDGRWPAEAIADGTPVRLAILPIGAFRFTPGGMGIGSHIGPREAIKVWNRLGRPAALPIHWGTFRLSNEGYATPPRMLALLMRCAGADTSRFAAHAIGATWRVPARADAPAIAEARVDVCAETPAVRSLP